MKKTSFTVCLLIFTFSWGIALPNVPKKTLSRNVQRTVSKGVAGSAYIKPTVTVKTASPHMQTQLTNLAAQASHTFVPRPMDALQPSISPQTKVVGSEKKETFAKHDPSLHNWKHNQQNKYYSMQDRARLQELLNGNLVKIDVLRPKAATNALEDYLYATSNKKNVYYIVPLYQNVLRMEATAKELILPYATTASLFTHEPRLPSQQLTEINQALILLINSSGKLLKLLPQDPYLEEVNDSYIKLFRIFNPLLGSVVGKNITLKRPDERTFDFNEFFLHNPEKKDYVVYDDTPWSKEAEEEVGSLHYLANRAATEAAQLLENLPQNWKIAVLNDDKQPLDNFRQWAAQGRLGKGTTVTTFEDGNDLLQDLKMGIHYDLILTDLLVPNGGIAMMPDLRKEAPNIPVIAMSKRNRQKANALHLFEVGMDGYLTYTTVLNNPEVGYLEYLRAIHNYLQLKNSKGWSR